MEPTEGSTKKVNKLKTTEKMKERGMVKNCYIYEIEIACWKKWQFMCVSLT
jgi:hypothetical protein